MEMSKASDEFHVVQQEDDPNENIIELLKLAISELQKMNALLEQIRSDGAPARFLGPF
jgi:hypothetical protein